MHASIEIKNLKKIYSGGPATVIAVNGINLTVHQGEIFGLLGPNGAGKTTTMRILTTLLKPTSGVVHIGGFDLATQPDKVRTHVGYVSQSGGLERSATARENLVLQARVYGMTKTEAQARADELISALELANFADRLVETYSGGQRRRADIALGMVHHPKLLFLDEPTIGLDPQSRAQIWQEVKKLKTSGTTILFTTHYLDEADLYCDRVAIVDHGKIVALGTPQELKKEIPQSGNTLPTLDDVFLQKTGHTFKQNKED
jgi:ABC-2 type transport system ATP-binding protein